MLTVQGEKVAIPVHTDSAMACSMDKPVGTSCLPRSTVYPGTHETIAWVALHCGTGSGAIVGKNNFLIPGLSFKFSFFTGASHDRSC